MLERLQLPAAARARGPRSASFNAASAGRYPYPESAAYASGVQLYAQEMSLDGDGRSTSSKSLVIASVPRTSRSVVLSGYR